MKQCMDFEMRTLSCQVFVCRPEWFRNTLPAPEQHLDFCNRNNEGGSSLLHYAATEFFHTYQLRRHNQADMVHQDKLYGGDGSSRREMLIKADQFLFFGLPVQFFPCTHTILL